MTHNAALKILGAAPTPGVALKLTRRRMVTLLQRSGRGNRPGLADTILAELGHPALRQSPAVEDTLGRAVTGLVSIIKSMEVSIADLESAMSIAFRAHHSARRLTAVPDLGTILGARVLSEIGDDRSRFATADGLRAFAGTAPITRASGRSKSVRTRLVNKKRLADACHWWAFASITKSPRCRVHYDRRRAAGDSHNAAPRNLANKLLGRLWWCLANDLDWDEHATWPTTDSTPAKIAA